METNNHYDAIILGAGPAGLTAGIYLSRAKLKIGRSRTLGVPGEEMFKGKGISYCATCDGDFFTGKEIFVAGGGNSALKEKIDLNQWGEIVVKSDMSTSIEGVYAAGDSTAKRYRQVTTAVGDGTIAALAASSYLNELKAKQKQLITV